MNLLPAIQTRFNVLRKALQRVLKFGDARQGSGQLFT